MEALTLFERCGHCGNTGHYKIVAKHEYSHDEDETHRKWFLLQCSTCSEPTLAKCIEFISDPFDAYPFTSPGHYVTSDGKIHHVFSDGTIRIEEVLFPIDMIKKHKYIIPNEVKRAYDAALKVQQIEPNAFAVLIGRNLEVICSCEHANGKTLAEKIKDLSNKGRIPQSLNEMAGQLRQLRNLAAHAAEDEVTDKDTPVIREFVDAILEYLYIAPSKIANLQARLDNKAYNSTTVVESWEDPF